MMLYEVRFNRINTQAMHIITNIDYKTKLKFKKINVYFSEGHFVFFMQTRKK